jgi:hypothetical protein
VSEEKLKAAVNKAKNKKQSRNSLTAKGIGYYMVRSKFLKGPDGYGRVISKARENLIAKNGGKDPGKDVVAAHLSPGAHLEKSGGAAKFKTRGENSTESNKWRMRHKLSKDGKKWSNK